MPTLLYNLCDHNFLSTDTVYGVFVLAGQCSENKRYKKLEVTSGSSIKNLMPSQNKKLTGQRQIYKYFIDGNDSFSPSLRRYKSVVGCANMLKALQSDCTRSHQQRSIQ